MNYNKIFRSSLFAAVAALAGISFSSCAEDLTIGSVDEGKYEDALNVYAYVKNARTPRSNHLVEIRGEAGEAMVYVGLNKTLNYAVEASLSIDEQALKDFNEYGKTEFEMYPAENVTLPAAGEVVIPQGQKVSSTIKIAIARSEAVQKDVTYAVPVKLSVKSENVLIDEAAKSYVVLVRVTDSADAEKEVSMVCCMEVNDTNPLNALEFTLKNSGKLFFDKFIIFAANININKETGRVFVLMNENVTHLLKNRDKYFKPLQDRGIKIILGLLGNHDASGVANMSQPTAQLFAQEVKAVLDAYQLDGFFLDDEYSKYQTPPPPGFVTPSNQAAARLTFELKRAMPDKLSTVYGTYGRTGSYPFLIDGMKPEEYVDYVYPDYPTRSDYSSSYLNMPKSQLGNCSMELNLGRVHSVSQMAIIKRDGYGAQMHFALNPFKSNFEGSQMSWLQRSATAIFDDEIVFSGVKHEKDW